MATWETDEGNIEFTHVGFNLLRRSHQHVDVIQLYNNSWNAVHHIENNHYSNAPAQENIHSLSHLGTRRLYDMYHNEGGFSISIGDYSYGRNEIDHLRRTKSHLLDLIPIINPELSGTTSLERLQQVLDYAEANTGEHVLWAGIRAQQMSLLRSWSAWVTHVVALGLRHSNRDPEAVTDDTRWKLIEGNMAYTLEDHLANGNVAQWELHFSKLDQGNYPDTGTKFYQARSLTRTDLGLQPTDDLPTRLKGPVLAGASTANPTIDTAHMDAARDLVLKGIKPYFTDAMKGPLPPPPAEESEEE